MKKAKTLNSQVYSLICKRLKLRRREKIIFYRFIGFLIRNDKPFPYRIKAMGELTGYCRGSVGRSINELESLRLIERVGWSSGVKYRRGSILKRAISLIESRIRSSEAFFNKEQMLKKRRNEFTKKYATFFMQLIERDGNQCNYCKRICKLTIDHIYPVSKGGEDCINNLQLLCMSCNSKKSNIL